MSAEGMRGESPIFRAPARGRIHGNLRTLDARVAKIRDLVRRGSLDPAVRKAAIAVLSKRCPDAPGGWCVAEKDWKGEAEAIFHFVRKNVRYTRDHTLADTFVHPARTLFDVRPGSGGGGDCDDYAITLGALLRSVGHTVKLRVVAAKNGEETPTWNHIYLIDCLPTGGAIAGGAAARCLALDASVAQPPGWEVPRNRIVKLRDFEV